MGYDKKKEQDILGRSGYICRRLLGKGAFSRVYLAEGKTDGGIYACKVSGNLELLEREAAVMAKLQHPLFPDFFRIWQEAGLGFLLMEYIPGNNLEKMLEHRKRFSVKQTARIGMELAEGLLYLHEMEEGILFRDVKPANIIIRQDGRVKLLDFGCVCAMPEGAASQAGTPGFAAPEQFAGKDSPEAGNHLTMACDVYGLGQTLKAVSGMDRHKNQLLEDRGRKEGRESKGSRRDEEDGGRSHDRGGRKNLKSGAGRKDGRDRRKRKQLIRILDKCTMRDASRRIPDMRGVMEELASIYDKKRGRFGQDIVCRKNIWESAYKNS